MANGEVSKNLTSNGQVRLINYWSHTPNKENNTSTIVVDTYLYFAYAIYSTAQKSGYITIGNETYYYNFTIGNRPNGGSFKIGSATRTVAHDANGELTVAITTSNTLGVTYGGTYIGTAANSFNLKMDKIARNSTIDSVGDFTSPTNSPTIKINAADPSFTHIVDFVLNGKTLFSRTGLKGGTHNLALSVAEQDLVLKEVTTTPSAKFTLILGTYNAAGNSVGAYPQKNGTVTVAENIGPIIDMVEYFDHTMVEPTLGIAWVGISKLQITTTALATKFATISLIEVVFNGFTYKGEVVITNVITDGYDYDSFTVTVTDSRGRKKSKTVYTDVWKMTPPNIETKAFRTNSSGVATSNGRYLRVQFQAQSGGGTYENQWKLEWRLSGQTNWTRIADGSEQAITFDNVYNLNLNPDSSYEVRSYYENMLYSGETIINIPTEFVTFDVRANGKGFALGKVSEKDAFEVAFPSEFNGGMSVRTSTDNAINNNLIFFNRLNGTLLAALNYDKTGNKFRLHRYDTNGTWKSYIDFDEDGTIGAHSRTINKTDVGVMTPQGGHVLNEISVRKRNGMIDVSGIVRGTFPPNTYVTVATLPAGYRPVQSTIVGGATSGGYSANAEIGSGGTIRLIQRTENNQTWISFNAVFIVN